MRYGRLRRSAHATAYAIAGAAAAASMLVFGSSWKRALSEDARTWLSPVSVRNDKAKGIDGGCGFAQGNRARFAWGNTAFQRRRVPCFFDGFVAAKVGPSVDNANQQLEKLGISINDLKESYTTSQGPGGQNVNKVETAVRLIHIPTGLEVKAQTHRSQLENRVSARRRLAELYKKEVLGELTKGDKRAQRIRQNKAKAARRRKKKLEDAQACASDTDSLKEKESRSQMDDDEVTLADKGTSKASSNRARQLAAAQQALRALEESGSIGGAT